MEGAGKLRARARFVVEPDRPRGGYRRGGVLEAFRCEEQTTPVLSNEHRDVDPGKRLVQAIKGVVLGSPFSTAQMAHERLTKLKALAIFSSDALSSSAYATEEILLILLLAGSNNLHYALPIAGVIALLIVIVTASYRQTIRAYPNGGGAYVVALENLGRGAGLTAGAALLVDYVLTVSVSVAAGIAAVTSAIPELHDVRVPSRALPAPARHLGAHQTRLVDHAKISDDPEIDLPVEVFEIEI